jgi:cytochrome c553
MDTALARRLSPEPGCDGGGPLCVARGGAHLHTSWVSGLDALLAAPELDSDVADVSALVGHLRELARKGKTSAAEQRTQIFAGTLTTCAGCHERLGVSPSPK